MGYGEASGWCGAGAGLVRGSVPERELQEVALKLGVLQQQLNLPVSEPPAGVPPGMG